MPDRTQLETELLGRYPEDWVRHHLDAFSPAYLAAFTLEEVAQHLELIRALNDEQLVITVAWPVDAGSATGSGMGSDRWWLEVVGYDAFEFLSTLCNLLAVHGLSIVEGRVFTSRPPPRDASSLPVRKPHFSPGQASSLARAKERKPDRRPKIVDRFLVRRTKREPVAPAWNAIQAELQALARLLREGQLDLVHHRLIGRVALAVQRQRGDEPGMEPLGLTIDAEADADATVVHLDAIDSFGFLSLAVSALALCGVMIVEADIRTDDGRVNDTLRVTERSGRKITAESQLRELRLSLILIEHFSRRLHRATNPEAALVHFSRFANETMARPAWAHEFAGLHQPEVLDALVRVLGESDFLWEDYLHTRPEDLLPMVGNPAEWRRRDRGELMRELQLALVGKDADARAAALRRFKDREVFRAGFRAILAPESAPETFSEELSDAAEVLLIAGFAGAADVQCAAWPRRADGCQAPAALFALGKFGGRELGFASDLELILVYDDRHIVDSPGALSAGAAFDGVVSALRRLLAGRQGSTFELDFRLRPYGRSGTPATSLSAFADYYRADGPAWSYERQAMIKLRPITGDPELIAAVETLRDHFVYGPLPFDLTGLRRMRQLQVEQRVQAGRINAKLSPGALVDVEYFVQAMQITHGGREPSVRTPSTERAIAALGAAGLLNPSEAATLQTCYRFFRSLVDALRVVHGHSRDLTVPPVGSEDFVLLARRMRQPDAPALAAELQSRLAMTRALSARLEEFLGPVT